MEQDFVDPQELIVVVKVGVPTNRSDELTSSSAQETVRLANSREARWALRQAGLLPHSWESRR